MSVHDNYNYGVRTLKPHETMYLSKIGDCQLDQLPKIFKKLNTKRDWSTNLYNLDIYKSTPRSESLYNNKISFINKINDIPFSSPHNRYANFIHKINYNLINSEIEGSSPKCPTLITKRCTNPLTPNYKLPSLKDFFNDKDSIPKFIRNNIDVSDIKGTSPKTHIRNINKNYDYFFKTKEEDKTLKRNFSHNYIDYSDITQKIIKTFRVTNPLDSIYKYDGKIIGPIENNKPCPFYQYKYDNNFNLKSSDIEGAQQDTKLKIYKFNSRNYNLNTKDIIGAQSDTKKYGIQTSRCTNPLTPK
jgi:hypothetical protein